MMMMMMTMKRKARLLFVITNGFKLTDTILKQACHTSFRSGLTARGVSAYSSSKLKQLLITTHRCSNPLQQITSTKTSAGGSSIHWPASVQHAVSFTRMLHSVWDTWETFVACVNKISFFWPVLRTNETDLFLQSLQWCHRVAKPWLITSACDY